MGLELIFEDGPRKHTEQVTWAPVLQVGDSVHLCPNTESFNDIENTIECMRTKREDQVSPGKYEVTNINGNILTLRFTSDFRPRGNIFPVNYNYEKKH